jgi:hypothetical protein
MKYLVISGIKVFGTTESPVTASAPGEAKQIEVDSDGKPIILLKNSIAYEGDLSGTTWTELQNLSNHVISKINSSDSTRNHFIKINTTSEYINYCSGCTIKQGSLPLLFQVPSPNKALNIHGRLNIDGKYEVWYVDE